MAHRDLEELVMTRDLLRYKAGVDQRMADMTYDAQWFSPLADALRAFVADTQKWVTGDVRLSLFKGNCTVVGRRSPYSLYVEELATYGGGDQFSHDAAVGFIRLWGLPMEVAASAQGMPDGRRPLQRMGREWPPISAALGSLAKPWGGVSASRPPLFERHQRLTSPTTSWPVTIQRSRAHAHALPHRRSQPQRGATSC